VSLLDRIRSRIRPRPLDWNLGAGRPPVERPGSVEVIIPVYGAPAALRECLRSVGAETDLTRHRVILVVDGPQESEVDLLVDDFVAAHAQTVRVLRNERRLGFVGSVNRGMSASTRDVVLLNSDTIVTSRWIEKLIDAATSCGDVGTVTPLSNHATICSVPRAFEENLLPTGFDVPSFAALVEEASERSYPRLPTGVGVCLYIRRALLDEIGLFDERRFGLGYGEENDFCMRALARGWLHLADDATFIYHAGHRSFGASRGRLQRQARATLRRIHPRYMATIAELMKLDPLAAVRARIDAALGAPAASRPVRRLPAGEVLPDPPSAGKLPADRPASSQRSDRPASSQRSGQPSGGQRSDPRWRIVHLVHGWPPFQQAGTELYAYWLARQQRAAHDVAVYARAEDPSRAHGEAVELRDDGVRVRLVTNNFTARNPLRRNAMVDRLLERDFARFLIGERPRLLHIHHLAGHAFSLARVARRLGIPIVLQIQDWWFLCARVNLFDRDGNRCSGPAPAKCARCATLTRIEPAGISNRLLHAMRRSTARAAVGACDAYVVGSRAIRDDYVRAGIVPPSKPIHVIPYGIEIVASPDARRPARRPIRFGYVGSIAPHKGPHVAVEALRHFDPSEAELHLWGDVTALPDYVEALRGRSGAAAVSFEGKFREDEKPRVFACMDVLLVPSVGLESFGLAAREAMACGVPVIASAGGALSEMFEPGLCGDFFPAGDALALRAILRRIIDEPEIVERWAASLPIPKRNDDHAAEIERVYASVLAARAGS
jgi:glycosyltransferase involved in cell wall biosynthesis/GT2 family glycosyltransferase